VKDNLLYLTIGLLIGIVVMQWTMPSGQASSALSNSGIVGIDGGTVALDEYGHTWWVALTEPHWRLLDQWSDYPADLPVAVSDVKLWSYRFLITQDNIAWLLPDDTGALWINCGPWPGGSVPTAPNTWGGVKSLYDGNK
jgi:hypothetical protein